MRDGGAWSVPIVLSVMTDGVEIVVHCYASVNIFTVYLLTKVVNTTSEEKQHSIHTTENKHNDISCRRISAVMPNKNLCIE